MSVKPSLSKKTAEKMLAEADAVYLDASTLVKLTICESHAPGENAARILVFGSQVTCFSSLVGFGEVVSCLGRKKKQVAIGGPSGYLISIRNVTKDFETGKIKPAEPPESRC